MERLIRIGQAAGLLGPAVVLLCLVLRYGVNVPKADQWVFVDLVGRLRAGASLWAELFSQHNEHRLVFPKLLMLGLAWLTSWNTVAEMVASVVVAAGTLLVLTDLAQPVLRQAGWAVRVWVPFILSAIIFSLVQWQNWLWGWQTVWFLGVFSAVSSIALAARSLRSAHPWIWVAGAAVMAIVCQFSMASGMIAWITTALVLTLHSHRYQILSVWVVLAAAASASYFVGYVQPAHHPTLLAALERPLEWVLYLGGYLAGPLGSHAGLGFAAVAAFMTFAVAALRRHWDQREHIVPWIAIGAFAGANAMITGIGRVGFGSGQGLESRYVTVALLLSIAFVPLGILALADESRDRVAPRRLLGGAAAIVLTMLVVAADVDALVHFDRFSRTVATGRDCLLKIEEASDDCLTALYPEPDTVRRLATPLRALGWSTYAGSEAPPVPTVHLTGPGGVREWRLEEAFGGLYGWVDSAEVDANQLTIVGWARSPSGGSGRRILVAVDNVIVAETDASLERGDVAAHFRDPGLNRSGWMVQTEILPRTARPRRLQVYLVVSDGILVPIGKGRTLPGDA